MELLEQLIDTTRERRLFRSGHSLLLALSGGPDSTALAHLLVEIRDEWRLRLQALHVNYGLRGEDSDEDERFVKETCRRLDIPLSLRTWEEGECGKGESLQMAARRFRYRLLEEEQAAAGADRIVTAHNSDDRVETLLLNLFRGAGHRGLGGIPYRRGSVVRPLLDAGRDSIERFLSLRKIPWCVDQTNRETKYDRNKIRLELIPYVEELLDRKIGPALVRAADLLSEADHFLDGEALRWIERHGSVDNRENLVLPAGDISLLPQALRRQVIRSAIRDTAGSLIEVRYDQIERIADLAGDATGGRIPLPRGKEARREGDRILFGATPGEPVRFEISLPLPGSARLPGGREVACRFVAKTEIPPDLKEGTGGTAYLDADAVEPPMLFRSRLPGDRFRPLGAPGSKKLQDLFVDRKVPRSRRDEIPILADERGVLWVTGITVADRAKVTDETSNILEVAFQRFGHDTKET